MRLTRSPLFRALVALAAAVASPGIDVSHGLAHDDDHHDAPSRAAGHAAGAVVSEAGHDEDHPHERISEALRIRADAPDFVAVGNHQVVAEQPVLAGEVSAPVADEQLTGDRATGPPPRLRAPPLD